MGDYSLSVLQGSRTPSFIFSASGDFPTRSEAAMSRALLLLVICILALSGLHPGDALNCYRCTGPGCVSPEKIQSVACMSTEDTCLKEMKSKDLVDRRCTNNATCEELKSKSTEDMVQCCYTDDCNGSVSLKWPSTLLLLVVCFFIV